MTILKVFLLDNSQHTGRFTRGVILQGNFFSSCYMSQRRVVVWNDLISSGYPGQQCASLAKFGRELNEVDWFVICTWSTAERFNLSLRYFLMWPIVVREEHLMYFLTSSHIEPFNFDCSLGLLKRWKYSELEHHHLRSNGPNNRYIMLWNRSNSSRRYTVKD